MPDTCEKLQTQMNIKCNQLPRKFVCILKGGHQIGKVCTTTHFELEQVPIFPPSLFLNAPLHTQPAPLIKKLDPKEIEGFRKKFGGSSTDTKAAQAADDSKLLQLLESLKLKDASEVAQMITEQGDKVRQLKAAKADKKEIETQVKVLLALKKSQTEKAAAPK